MARRRRRSLAERLRGLANFAPIFSAPGFEFGGWDRLPYPGMPYYEFSEAALSFIDMAYRLDWVLRDFDWGEWQNTEEARRFCDDPREVSGASVEQLAKLVSLYVRGDRFCDGALASAFESGLLASIASRAAELLAARASKPRSSNELRRSGDVRP